MKTKIESAPHPGVKKKRPGRAAEIAQSAPIYGLATGRVVHPEIAVGQGVAGGL